MNPRKSQYTSNLVPDGLAHTLTFPSILGQQQKLFCRVTTPRGRRSLLPRLQSRSHRIHAEAQDRPRSLALQGSELAGRKGPGSTPICSRPRLPVPSPAPCTDGCPPHRPGLLGGLALGRIAAHEEGAHRSRAAWRGERGEGGAGRLGLARAAKGKGREESVATAEAEARCWRQLGCDKHLIQTGH